MSDDTAAKFDIVEEHGSFLLIRAGSGLAVVERRAGRIYPMTPGGREGEPITAEGAANLMAEQGWFPSPKRVGSSRNSAGGAIVSPVSFGNQLAMTSSAAVHASQVCRISSGVWASDT